MNYITVNTQIKAPLSQVWRSFTLPEHIVHWYFASDDWHCPEAKNDVRKGGKFSFRMSAKDESMAFDFAGSYDQIIENELIEFHLDDGRKVKVTFEEANDHTNVTEHFEPEGTNPEGMQRDGWQAILTNFKKYTEGLNRLEKLNWEVEIDAAVDKVFRCMLEDKTYREWTAEFNPTSFYRGKWYKGEKILFIGTDEIGNESGMVSRIKEFIPNELVSIEHLGILVDNKEIVSGLEVKSWAGSLEEYRYEDKNGTTLLKIDMDSNQEYKSYFQDAWPRALKKLKEICEQ